MLTAQITEQSEDTYIQYVGIQIIVYVGFNYVHSSWYDAANFMLFIPIYAKVVTPFGYKRAYKLQFSHHSFRIKHRVMHSNRFLD